MQGTHIIADLKNINFESLQISEQVLEDFFSKIIAENNLTQLGSYYHTFWNPNEVTWVIALAESHTSFHTWPEFQYVSVDIFVCNLRTDCSQKAEMVYNAIIDFFEPKHIENKIIERDAKN